MLIPTELTTVYLNAQKIQPAPLDELGGRSPPPGNQLQPELLNSQYI